MVEKIEIGRTRVGIAALVFGMGAGGIFLFAPERVAVMSSLLRMSLLLGALWLAAPSKYREAAWANVSPWVLILGFATLVMLVRFPFVVFPILAGLFFLSMFVKPIRRRKQVKSAEEEPATSSAEQQPTVIDVEAERKS